MVDDAKAKPIHGSFAGAPENGVRFDLVLRETAPGRAVYAGHAHTPDCSWPLTVVAEAAAARATIEGEAASAGAGASASAGAGEGAGARAGIEKMAAALVRAATRAELTAGDPVPSKIVRWRAL